MKKLGIILAVVLFSLVAFAQEVDLTSLNERLGLLETNVLNLQGTIDDGLPALRDMIYELSANIASVEERLTSYVQVASDEARQEQ